MDIDKISKELKGFRCFAGLNELEINKLLKYSVYHEIRKGKILFYQGDTADIAYFILSGKIKKIIYKADETSMVIGRSTSGDWIGFSEVLLKGPYLFDAVPEEQSRILLISARNLNTLLQMAGFKDGALNAMAREYYQIHSELGAPSPYEKIVNFLQARMKSFVKKDKKTGHFIVEVTQEALAESIGFTRETVNKYLHELQEKGVISLARGCIKVIKPEELKA